MAHYSTATRPEMAERSIQKALKASIITDSDERLIREYLSEYRATRHISTGRANKITYALVGWRRFLEDPFLKTTLTALYDAIGKVKGADSERGRRFKQNTIHDKIRILKRFFLWLQEEGKVNIPREKLQQIRFPPVDTQTTSPDELLTPEEVLALIRAARSPRDRAMVAAIYESGCRIGELVRLRWKDMVFDEYGVGVHIHDTKTQKIRYARLTSATEYLATWKNACPWAGPDDFLFPARHGTVLTHSACSKIFRLTAQAAGIQKKVRAHIFRKSRITHMIRENYQESVIKAAMWGNLNTQMFSTYVVLSEKDIDAEYLERTGVRTRGKEEKTELLPRPCSRCHTINAPTSDFCGKCGLPLTENAVDRLEQLRQDILNNPEGLIRLLQKRG